MALARIALAACLFTASVAATAAPATTDLQRWQATAQRVTVMRDTWGIPHLFGKTDADAVFGLMYAQAEDDFNRVELNYINAMGRLAEVDGEGELWRDLRMKMYITPTRLKALYATSPAWLKKLMVAYADGLNYYLHTHPEVKPKLITRFEPWMALSFSEGSIGGDIEDIRLKPLQQFYGKGAVLAEARPTDARHGEPTGSNGFAIAPSMSATGHAMLMINPHTSFYFRPEVHMVSEEGLNAYGAVTWGQFFIYQGFNDRAGWMHTSGGADVIDEYLETVTEKDGKYFYQYGATLRPMKAVPITLPYKTATGMASKTVTAYFTHHGPVIREAGGKWVSVKMMDDPLTALTQSYTRTKARNYAAFSKTMDLRTNSSNNTVYADADGTIAYFHGNFVPRRDVRFDWRKPVDGSDPATEWKGLHTVAQTIHLRNPASGYLHNTNNWPFSGAGASSPKQQDYPAYMWANPENARGINAARVMGQLKPVNIDGLISMAYDSHLAAFDILLPSLFAAYDALPESDAARAALAQQVAALRAWDRNTSLASTPTSLAVYWGRALNEAATGNPHPSSSLPWLDYMLSQTGPAGQLKALERASARLQADFGNWQTPWGEINRFQRIDGNPVQQYDDSKPSWPVGFGAATWGSLASLVMKAPQTTKRTYGDHGNSFVAAVEFGPRIRAKSILAGGNSGNPASKHFSDQAEMYSKGQFKDVQFYKRDIEAHLERQYHPGE
jgi:acyl-homoserine-lactone acylase